MAARVTKPRPLTRRKFFAAVLGAMSAATGGVAYTRFWEPQWLEVSRVEARIGNGPTKPNRLRIVHLSDLHASADVPLAFIDEAIDLALAQRPDLIALTGDYFTREVEDAPRYSEILRRLSRTAPTFACLGNHDGGPWTRAAGGYAGIDEAVSLLSAASIPCLNNDAVSTTIRGRALQIIGVGDLWSRMCDPVRAFRRTPIRASAARVVLNHNPDAKELLSPFDWDVMLCGHTHGGQVRLPFFGTPFAPVRDKRYVEGLHFWNNRWLHVTRGVGNLHGLRFNCRPQVSVVEIL